MDNSLSLNVVNETGTLKSVILGIGTSIGQPANNNPKAKHYLDSGIFPTEDELVNEITQFEAALTANGVKVYRPEGIDNLCQIFTRDIGFVIDDYFFISAIKESRKGEITGIRYILDQIPKGKVINLRDETPELKIEGGDIIVWDDYILIAKSDRSDDAGYEFIKSKFPHKKVVQIPINVSSNYLDNMLHLDCALQPVGANSLILYREGIKGLGGIKTILDILEDKGIPLENVIEVDKEQAYRMFPNIFSISKDLVVIEKSFVELKERLIAQGIGVVEVDYVSTSKLGGLLRCSTLPLERIG